MSKDANIAAQEHLAGNINAGDVDTAVQSFAADAVDHDPAPGQGPGREGFRTFWKTMTSAFPDAHIEPRHEVVDDEHVVVAYTLSGTTRATSRASRPPAGGSRSTGARSPASPTARSSAGAAATSSASCSSSGPSPSRPG